MPIDFDIEAARKSGATDQQIADYFKQKYSVDFDIAGARKAGANDTQILEYINSKYDPQKKSTGQTGGGESGTPESKSNGINNLPETVRALSPDYGVMRRKTEAEQKVKPKFDTSDNAPAVQFEQKLGQTVTGIKQKVEQNKQVETDMYATRNLAKQKMQAAQEVARRIQELQQVYNDPNTPIEQKQEAASRLQVLQSHDIGATYKEAATEYNQTLKQEAEIQTEKARQEELYKQGLEGEYDLVRGLIEGTASSTVKALTGIVSAANTLNNYLSVGYITPLAEGEQDKASSEARAQLQEINKWADEINSQPVPENFKDYFGGDFTAKKLGYIVSQAVSSTAPTVAAGILTGGVGAAITGGGMMYGESYDVLKNAGLSEKDASLGALGMAIPLGMLEQAGVSDVIKAVASKTISRKIALEVAAKIGTEQLTKEQVFQIGKKATTEYIKDFSKAMLKTSLKEGLTEGEQAIFTEVSKQVAESQTGQDSNAGQTTGEYLAETGKNVAQEVIGGFLGGAVFGAGGAAASAQMTKTGLTKALELEDPEKMNDFVEALKSEVAEGTISQEQADNALNNIKSIQEVNSTIPDNITDLDTRLKAANLISERKQIESSIEGKDESLVAPQKQRIQEIDAELSNIANEPAPEPVVKQEEINITPEQVTTVQETAKSLPKFSGMWGYVYDALVSGNPDETQEAIKTISDQIKSDENAVRSQIGDEIVDVIKGVPQENVVAEEKVVEPTQEQKLKEETEATNDSENITRVSGEIGIGEEPVKTEPVESTSPQETGDSGILQDTSEEVVTTPEEEQASHEEHDKIESEIKDFAKEKGIEISDDDLGDLATLKSANEDMTTEEVVNTYIENKPEFEKNYTSPDNIIPAMQAIEQAKQTKKSVREKQVAAEKAAKEHGVAGEKAIFIDNNFSDIVGKLKKVKDTQGQTILKVKC